MKIQLQYIYFNPPAGGVENYFRAAGDYFSRRGDRVSVFCSRHPLIPAPTREYSGSFQVIRHPYYSPARLFQPLKPLCYLRYLKKTIRRTCGEIDLFISRHPYYARAAKLAFPGRPLIFLPPDLRTRRLREQLDGSLQDRVVYYLARPQIDLIERGAVLSADRVITLSLNLKRQFERYHRIPSDRIEVAPPPVWIPGASIPVRRKDGYYWNWVSPWEKGLFSRLAVSLPKKISPCFSGLSLFLS